MTAVAEPLAQIGWSGEATATKDPRVPVVCRWCNGAKVLLETIAGQGPWVLIPVVCRGCSGAGEVRIERRRG